MKSQTPEMARFNDALRSVMQVSKTDLNAMLHSQDALDSVKQKKGPKPKS
jgi:hypothetical protein